VLVGEAEQCNVGNPVYGRGASSLNRAPDLTAHVRYEDKKLGHVQLSGIYRYLSVRNDWPQDSTQLSNKDICFHVSPRRVLRDRLSGVRVAFVCENIAKKILESARGASAASAPITECA
jgi:hypothetical protein